MAVPREKFLSSVWRDGIFKNKVLFCTGGAGTICSMQVRAFVALGGNACITGRNLEKTEKGAAEIAKVRPGAKVIGLSADVRDMKAMQQAVERCVEELGSLDFAIAGAAGNFLAPLSQLSSNAFKTVIDIDTIGSFNTAKAVLPYLIESARKYKNTGTENPAGTGGRIIFVSASFHFTGGRPLQAHAAAAKAAVDQIAQSVAVEYGPYGITSNVITPGPIAGTEGMERLAKSDESSLRRSQKAIPLGRWGTVKEIADATVYLFSDAANYVNAATEVVDGGQWRVSGASLGPGLEYPDFLLSHAIVEGVKSGRKPASKL